MGEIALVYVLFGNRKLAEATAQGMIAHRLAACANVLAEGCSIYPWQGAIEKANETPVLFKTTPDRCEALMQTLAQTHDYDLPAILSWPARTTAAYAAWVKEQTLPEGIDQG